MKTFLFYSAAVFYLSFISCGNSQPDMGHTEPISHHLFDSLLSTHVDDNGMVDYKGFRKDSIVFNQYLDLLCKNPPNSKKWTESEQLAYWINAYNAFTIELILKYYPLASIKDIGSAIQIPYINTPWDIKFIEFGNVRYDLNNIEHSILRKEFNEPRIHFAIVCAAKSCPSLRKEAYVAEKLEDQLTDQTIRFLNDKSKNILEQDNIQISKIFSWFKGDFTKKSTLNDFLNKYTNDPISDKAKISHMDYDWSLNE